MESKAIVLVIDADAQQSDVVKQVVEALERAGIATGKTAETAPPANSSISVTLGMRSDESYEKLKQLIEALRNVGVQQISFHAGGVRTDGGRGTKCSHPACTPGIYDRRIAQNRKCCTNGGEAVQIAFGHGLHRMRGN